MAFLLFSLLPDWLKLNHLRSRMECGFSDIFVQKTTFEAAEMVLGLWNQQISPDFEANFYLNISRVSIFHELR